MNVVLKQEKTSFASEKRRKHFRISRLVVSTQVIQNYKASIIFELDEKEVRAIIEGNLNGADLIAQAYDSADISKYLMLGTNANLLLFPMQVGEEKMVDEDSPAFQNFLGSLVDEAEKDLKTNKKSYSNINDLLNALQD